MKYPATTTIMAVTIALHLATYIVGNGATDAKTARAFGALLSANQSPTELPYLLTATYQHIGGMMHLLANMWFVLISAPYLERLFGSFIFALLYNVTGIAGALVTFFFADHSISSGASAAGYGMMGVYLALVFLKRGVITPQMKQLVLTLVGIGIVMTLVVPNISITGHLGGLFSGMILGSFLPFSKRQRRKPIEGVLWALVIPLALLVVLNIPKNTLATNGWATEQPLFSVERSSERDSSKGISSLYDQYNEGIYVHSKEMIALYKSSLRNEAPYRQREIAGILKKIQKERQELGLATIDAPIAQQQELSNLYAQLEYSATLLEAALVEMDAALLNEFVASNDRLVARSTVFLEGLQAF